MFLLALVGFEPVRPSAAQSKPMAVYVEGPNAEAARAAIIDSLPAGVIVTDDQTFRKELVRQGQKKPFGRNVDSRSVDRVRRAAAAVGADTVLLVRVHKAQPSAALLLLVGPSGRIGADHEIHLRAALRDADREELRRSLPKYDETPSPPDNAAEVAPATPTPGDVTTRGQEGQPSPAAPPPAPAPAPMAVPPPRESPENETAATTRPGRPVDARAPMTSLASVALNGGVDGRRFEYRNGIGPNRFTLSQPAVPIAGVGAELFPLAAHGGPWGDVGFVGDYSMLFAPSWAGTNPIGYDVGMRARIHPGSNPPVLLNVSVGYEFRWFGAYDSGGERLPEVTYRSIRPAVGVRLPMGRFALLAGTAVHVILNPSGISEQFYNPTGIGFDAHVGFTAMFLAHFEARLAGSYSRYSFSFKPPAGATFGTGGAIDQLYGGQLAIAYVY